ncbi:peptidoglycan-binding protein [Streptomyces sp. NPDC053499]|uniref:peptidoglycan-binding protein n=1 Tax=Streptomyces sp. NPDC053499 TaxID=3365707 RepID=UPI0037D41DE5
MTALGRRRKGALEKLRGKLEALHFDGKGGFDGDTDNIKLAHLIDEALGFPAPDGSPDTVAGKAADYRRAATLADEVRSGVSAVATAGLPNTWVGEAGSKASEVTKAAARSAERMSETFGTAARELVRLAEGIGTAQSKHDFGLDALRAARNMLPEGDNAFFANAEDAKRARKAALDGIGYLESGVEAAEEAGKRAERELDKLASEARSGRLDTRHLSDADRVVLTDAAAHGGDPDENEILTNRDLERSGVRLNSLSAHDRAAYDKLLDGAKSPQERAYLVKALAAGYPMSRIQDFAHKIHPYGDKPAWLQKHLTPIVTRSDDSRREGDQSNKVTFDGQMWDQEGPTCVALSTVTMHAQSDPLYALELTTGGHPGDPDYDNGEAFEERLRDEETRVYDRRAEGQVGMVPRESEMIADDEIGAHTGADYDTHFLKSKEARADVLPQVRDAVNSGQPVPVGVDGSYKGGHQMMIIGEEGGRLQIYNPWGFTTWVTEDDFVNGTMAGASNYKYTTPAEVHLPRTE